MTSPANINSLTNTIPPTSTTQPNSDDSLSEKSIRYAVKFDNHLRALQKITSPKRSVSERTRALIIIANEAIEGISNLASTVIEATNTREEPTLETKTEIQAAEATAATLENEMYKIMGSGTTYHKTPEGLLVGALVVDISRYFDYVRSDIKEFIRDEGNDT